MCAGDGGWEEEEDKEKEECKINKMIKSLNDIKKIMIGCSTNTHNIFIMKSLNSSFYI